ncbi:EF-hand [Auriculariales sp. MPI-PUGE-AT-0066]|nr:EF-hand [Auriculariales sp. MPI-PUGE-AT-0066]
MNRLSQMLSHQISQRNRTGSPAQQGQQQPQGAQLQHSSSVSSQYGSQYHQPPPGSTSGYGGGFQAPGQHYGPPPGADPQLWSWFSAVDVDHSGSISPLELQQALVNGNFTSFDIDTVKMLLSIFDTDRSGTIGFHEFAGLWKYIADWQNVFRHFDADRSGSIDRNELGSALNSFGYRLSPRTIQLICDKYCALPSLPTGLGYAPSPGITFDRFVRACVVVKTLSESFQTMDTDRDGVITIGYDQFMRVALGSP